MQLLSCDLWLMDRKSVRNLASLAEVLAARGNLPPLKTEAAMIEAVSAKQQQSKQRSVAVIPISGALEARPTELGAFLGMSSYEVIGKVFDHFAGDTSVSAIVLDVSSPGGMVYGAPELAEKIYQARGTKPIIAVANPMAASGGYWLAAAADRVVMTPSADVGSVGVITEHVDMSRRYEQAGITITPVHSTASPHKGELTDAAPLSDEAKQHLQARADSIHAKFAGDLARFRGVSVQHVNEHFGRGRVVQAKEALAAGMVDRVGTMEEIIGKLMANRIRIGGERAQDDWNAPSKQQMLRERVATIRANITAEA